MMDHHSVISFNWNLWDTLKKNIEDIYDSTDCCLPQATFMTIYGFNWQNITAIENSQLMIEDAYLFRCCCLVAPRLFTFCALFCRFILKQTVNRQNYLQACKEYLNFNVHEKIMISALSLLDWPASNFSLKCHPWIT